jgi:RNA polymerase sigma-70 factor (ECF subfamily)
MTLTTPLVLWSRATASSDRVRLAIERNFESLWRFLRRMGVPERDTEDAAQAVLLVFTQRVDAIAEGAERSFLFGTALRVAADYRKHAERSREIVVGAEELPERAHPAPSADRVLSHRRLLACLDAALGRLDPPLREVFVLTELEELTMAEIAELLGIPQGTVASRLRRARERFEAEARELRSQFVKEVDDG